jgi:hypothetical protein
MQYGALFQQIEIRQRSRTRRLSAGTVTDLGVLLWEQAGGRRALGTTVLGCRLGRNDQWIFTPVAKGSKGIVRQRQRRNRHPGGKLVNEYLVIRPQHAVSGL